MFFRKRHKIFKKLIILFISGIISIPSISADTKHKTVNLLTWWGYLNYPQIKALLKKQCNVEISYDEYYSNDEFLRRFNDNKSNYDIIIFSNTIYDLIKDKIILNKSPLSLLAKKYNPIVRKQYVASKYPPNVVFYMLSLSGFLWNPEMVSLDRRDTIQSLFEKVKNNIVIMIDDPVEAWNLLNREFDEKNFAWDHTYRKSIPLTPKNFKNLIQKSDVYITNDFNQLYSMKNFGFAFMWTGDAIVDLKKSKMKYQFLIHPKLSYISTDLLANLNNNEATLCVAKVLNNKKVLDIIQNNDFYFSPYGNYKNVKDETYRKIYGEMYDQLDKLPWLIPVSAKNYEHLTKTWYEIKLSATKK